MCASKRVDRLLDNEYIMERKNRASWYSVSMFYSGRYRDSREEREGGEGVSSAFLRNKCITLQFNFL